VIEAELGAPPEHFFSEIDEMPFAAASIGQLHRARLRSTGALVAVKIRRPYINDTMLADIGLIRWFIRLLIRLRVAPTFRWDDFYVELERTLSEELDYRFEATYLRQMRRNLRRHKVYVPKVYLACSRQSVLTMEFIQGALMSDLLRLRHKEPERVQAWLRENRIDTRRLGRRLFNSLARQGLRGEPVPRGSAPGQHHLAARQPGGAHRHGLGGLAGGGVPAALPAAAAGHGRPGVCQGGGFVPAPGPQPAPHRSRAGQA
jgi:predicted unusual protein kinase regulating ubiquinone biosynthesis (AarF/ABC1/UbiB family)